MLSIMVGIVLWLYLLSSLVLEDGRLSATHEVSVLIAGGLFICISLIDEFEVSTQRILIRPRKIREAVADGAVSKISTLNTICYAIFIATIVMAILITILPYPKKVKIKIAGGKDQIVDYDYDPSTIVKRLLIWCIAFSCIAAIIMVTKHRDVLYLQLGEMRKYLSRPPKT